jgi:predicted metalloenzyme YecM
MTAREILAQFKLMEREERAELLHDLIDIMNIPTPSEKRYDVRDFRGIGADFADGTDAQAYVNQLRSEWDHRP